MWGWTEESELGLCVNILCAWSLVNFLVSTPPSISLPISVSAVSSELVADLGETELLGKQLLLLKTVESPAGVGT